MRTWSGSRSKRANAMRVTSRWRKTSAYAGYRTLAPRVVSVDGLRRWSPCHRRMFVERSAAHHPYQPRSRARGNVPYLPWPTDQVHRRPYAAREARLLRAILRLRLLITRGLPLARALTGRSTCRTSTFFPSCADFSMATVRSASSATSRHAPSTPTTSTNASVGFLPVCQSKTTSTGSAADSIEHSD